MKDIGLRCSANIVGVTIALLAGCGGSQPLISAPAMPGQSQTRSSSIGSATREPSATPNRPEYETTGPLVYATNELNSENWDGVTVYRARADDPSPVAKISDGLSLPFGACVDAQGTLYVTNEPVGAGWVSEYPLGKTKPSLTITDGIDVPAYCAIDANGNLWVTNGYSHNVTEYLKGSKKPHEVITKGLVNPVGIAIDRSGDLYVGNFTFSSEHSVENVVVYAPESKSPSRTITNGVTSPIGLAVDSNGTLFVANLYQNNIAEYRLGQDHPFQTITDAMDHPAGVAVDKKGLLYVSNVGNNTIVEFAPGSITPLKRQISNGLYEPNGVARYPESLP